MTRSPAPTSGHVARLSESPSDAVGRLREISVHSIHPNPNQPRKHFDEATLGALADSIRERGLLQPIIVRPTSPDAFELVAGERRWRAAQIAGDLMIPALIDDKVDEAGSLELALIENVVREDLTPIEEARTIALLLEDPNITETLLSKRLGRSRTDIAHTVRLLDLPDQAIELIDAGVLTKGHGKALLTEPDHGRRQDPRQTRRRSGLVRPDARGRDSAPRRRAARSGRHTQTTRSRPQGCRMRSTERREATFARGHTAPGTSCFSISPPRTGSSSSSRSVEAAAR